MALFAGTGLSQVRPAPNDSMSADKAAPGAKSILEGTPAEEMHARRSVKLAEKEHLENLERAREAARISAQLRDTFAAVKSFSHADKKKLERVEKLTRKIRSEAGGSDSELALEKIPRDLESAVTRLAFLSEEMRKAVEKTPRQVVSAAVIERANQLLDIIQYARKFNP